MTLVSRVARGIPEGILVRLISAAYRRFEPEIRHLDEVCGHGGTMVDIGGWYGPWARRLVRRADQVVVIEPTQLHETLRRTLPRSVSVIEAAASDHEGTAGIWLPSAGGASRGISSLHRRDAHDVSVKVPLVTVDGLGLRDVTFMKIDVDGHEIPVLRGAAATIARDRPRLLIEVEQRFQPAAAVTGLLESWNYRGWVLPGHAWVPLESFPLVAHQAAVRQVADRGLLARAVWPLPRYVNSVLFLPDGQMPSRVLPSGEDPGRGPDEHGIDLILGNAVGQSCTPLPAAARLTWRAGREMSSVAGHLIRYGSVAVRGWCLPGEGRYQVPAAADADLGENRLEMIAGGMH